MAYSNYGATVYRDEEPLHQNCDATVKQVLGDDDRYPNHLCHFIKKQTEKDFGDEMYHAVVGDADAGILVLLYKSSPSMILKINHKGEWEVVKFSYDWEYEWKLDVVAGDVTVHLEGIDEPDGVQCSFTDRKGRKWFGKSAYCYGEGHQPWGGSKELG